MTLTTVHPDMLDTIPKARIHEDAHPMLVQQVYAETKAHSPSNATIIPHDDTIPQSGEGTEFLTASITPTSASNYLLISGQVMASGNNGPSRLSVAIFRDSGANAIYATQLTAADGNQVVTIPFRFRIAAGSVSATTFKIRAGSNTGTFALNGINANRLFGGVAVTCLQIDEISS
jgi:hypothetical protein